MCLLQDRLLAMAEPGRALTKVRFSADGRSATGRSSL